MDDAIEKVEAYFNSFIQELKELTKTVTKLKNDTKKNLKKIKKTKKIPTCYVEFQSDDEDEISEIVKIDLAEGKL